MFGFGMPEMIIVLVIALVVFGPTKLPELGKALGSGIRNFKKASLEDDREKISVNEQEKG